MSKVLVTDTNLTNIANAIRNKNGTSNTYKPNQMATAINEIETGTDTSDATATADDILYDKTAYIATGKVTGNIMPGYEFIEKTPELSEHTITVPEAENISMYMARSNILVYYTNTSHLYLLDMNNPALYHQYSLTDLGISGIDRVDINSNNTKIILGYGTNNYIYCISGVIISSEKINIRATYLNFCDTYPKLIIGATGSYSSSSGYTYCYYFANDNNLVYTTNPILGGSWHKIGKVTLQGNMITNYNSWSSSRWSIHGINSDGTYDNEIATGSSTQPTFMLCSPHRTYINIDYNTSVHNFRKMSSSETATYRTYTYDCDTMGYYYLDRYVYFIKSNFIALYDIETNQIINTITTTLVPNNTIFIDNGQKVISLVNNTFKVFYDNNSYVVRSYTIHNTKYLDTTDGDISANDVLQNKVGFSQGTKVVGTIVDNGPLNYTPTMSQQIIPEGYTSGGIISSAVMGEEDYNTCVDLADYIMYGGEPPLPYTELEYIQSTGTQYINTVFYPNQDTRVKMNYQFTRGSSSNDTWLMGARTRYDSQAFAIAGYYNQEPYYFINYNKTNSKGPQFDSDEHELDFDKNVVKLDGETVRTHTVGNFTTPRHLYLLASNNADGFGMCSAKLYSAQVYDNGTLIRDFIPVKRKEDDVVCMYDKVSETFFLNAGTGSFIAGPVKGGNS